MRMKTRMISLCAIAGLTALSLAGCSEAAVSGNSSAASGSTSTSAAAASSENAVSAGSAAVSTVAMSGGSSVSGVNQIPEGTEEASAENVDFSSFKIGEIESYVVNDGGWCQATHNSILSAMNDLGIPEDNLITLESIDDTDQASVQEAAEQLVDQGCNLIIGASTGYSSYLPEIAEKNPDVIFAQWGNKVDGLVGYEIRSYEGMFLAGYACELLSQDQNTELGYSASYNEFSVRTAINAYALGAKYANADAKVKVASADSWYDIDKETQCAQSLIDSGIKYMGMEASSPAIPETCEKNGAFVVGYHNDMSSLAPKAVLVSFEWNFAPIFKSIITRTAEKTATPDDFYYWGGDCSKLSDFADFVPEDVVQKVTDLKSKLESGEVQVYAGELKDNQGNVLVKEGQVMSDEDIIQQNFFVDNVETSWTVQ